MINPTDLLEAERLCFEMELAEAEAHHYNEQPPMRQKTRTIHNNLTAEQLAITQGTLVEYTHDNGSKTTHKAITEPERLSGHTWVAWLEGVRGCVALSRCRPI